MLLSSRIKASRSHPQFLPLTSHRSGLSPFLSSLYHYSVSAGCASRSHPISATLTTICRVRACSRALRALQLPLRSSHKQLAALLCNSRLATRSFHLDQALRVASRSVPSAHPVLDATLERSASRSTRTALTRT